MMAAKKNKELATISLTSKSGHYQQLLNGEVKGLFIQYIGHNFALDSIVVIRHILLSLHKGTVTQYFIAM